jgi:hypothetical protein
MKEKLNDTFPRNAVPNPVANSMLEPLERKQYDAICLVATNDTKTNDFTCLVATKDPKTFVFTCLVATKDTKTTHFTCLVVTRDAKTTDFTRLVVTNNTKTIAFTCMVVTNCTKSFFSTHHVQEEGFRVDQRAGDAKTIWYMSNDLVRKTILIPKIHIYSFKKNEQ